MSALAHLIDPAAALAAHRRHNRALSEHGPHGRNAALVLKALAGGPATMAELAKATRLSPTKAATACVALHRSGLIHKHAWELHRFGWVIRWAAGPGEDARKPVSRDAALRACVDVMRRSCPDYCAAHGVERASDAEWDRALEAAEDVIDDARGAG